MRLILLGAPGAGKGTQGALLAKSHGLARISTGDILREAAREGTPLGREARTYMEAGELVPDDVILGLVRDVIDQASEGFVLDGFPRTIEQARGLDAILDELDLGLDAVVVLEVPDDVLVQRLSGRRSCPDCNAVYNIYFDPPRRDGVCDRCGGTLVERADDREETVKRRLEVYRRQTQPLIEHYRLGDTPVLVVEGTRAADEVQASIRHAIAA